MSRECTKSGLQTPRSGPTRNASVASGAGVAGVLALCAAVVCPALARATSPAGAQVGLPRTTTALTLPRPTPAKPATAAEATAPEASSYAVGLMLGEQLEHSGLLPVLSVDELVQGLKAAIGGHAATAAERDAALRFMRSARDAMVEHNRTAAHEFLDRNAKQPGVVSMPSGLQYRVLAEGDSKASPPAPTDQVTVRYRASLADGTEFDRSDTHDRPATFRVNSVFKGWQEAFAAMRPGATWQLFVPPELGYGANSPPMVPPGALLVYEIELLKVEHPEPRILKPGGATPAAAAAAPDRSGDR